MPGLVFVGLSLNFAFDALGYEQSLYFNVTAGVGEYIYGYMQGRTSYLYGFLQRMLLDALYIIPVGRRIMDASTPEVGCSRPVQRYCSRRRYQQATLTVLFLRKATAGKSCE